MENFYKKALSVLVLSLLPISSVFASVIYTFDFIELKDVGGGSGNPFQISLTYKDYVTETGLKPLVNAPYSTSLGYSVNYSGSNSISWWAFDDDNAGILLDDSFTYFGLSFLAVFNHSGYITAPGVYEGWVSGNAPTSFGGKAILTVTDNGVTVPEPSELSLLMLGMLGLSVMRKRKKI